MGSIYDVVSVTLFLCVLGGFLFLTGRQPAVLSRLLLSAVAIAVANQLGNAGHNFLACALLVSAGVFGIVAIRSHLA